MTDTPRRRPPLPTREGTLKLKSAGAAPASPGTPSAPAKAAAPAWRKRSKASHPEQTGTETPARAPRREATPGARDERPPRPAAERPTRGFGDKPARGFGERGPRPDGERPRRADGERPSRPDSERRTRPDGEHPRHRDERPPRAADDAPRGSGERGPRPERSADGPARPPRHERKQWSGEARPAPAPSPLGADGSIRLSKRMTELGLCSRREADEYIEKGWVRVDGRVVSELGSRVQPTQLVELDRRGQTAQDRRVTILLNKPVGYVSGQAEDGYQPASVLITEENRWAEDSSDTRYLNSHHRGLAPAGRLDIDSVGLLVFTQDGRVARQLIGDESAVEKEYHVRVDGRLDADGLALLNHGLSLDGEALRPAKVSWLNEDQLRFVLREGKKRQIRRMCELVGLKVVGLKRVRIGRVMLGNLPPGQWRYLGAHEAF